MFKRLFNALKRTHPGTETYPLCRLRHATLHPGATLWTPGVGGGNLGGGASNALDEAGIGGKVIVGFQSGAREQIHASGTLAQIEERLPFPKGWEPAGLGANHRYLLRGLQRVQIDLDSPTHKRLPTVRVTDAPPLPIEAQPPTAELRAILAALSTLDNDWPDHWRDAFITLPEAPIGQWATTLGWRLSGEERLDLFDHPEKIDTFLLQTLDALHMGLAPERRREAIRAQALTRRTSIMPERTIAAPADQDGVAIFHPSDLQEREVPGNTIQIPAPAGAQIRLRLTAGPLTEPEQARALPPTKAVLLVRHGRLFFGEAGLLSIDRYQDHLAFADATRWFDIPNGLFRVTITPLRPQEHAPYQEAVLQLRIDDTPTDPSAQEDP